MASVRNPVDIPSPHPLLLAQQRRKKRWRIIWICLALCLALALAGAKPIYRSLKDWRANHLALQAEKLMAEQNWRPAVEAARAGYQLAPKNASVLRAFAHLQSRTGNPAGALQFWKEFETEASPDDRREYAEDLLKVGQLAEAEHITTALLNEDGKNVRLHQLAARIFAARQQLDPAIVAAQRALALDPKNAESRLLLASLQVNSADVSVRDSGLRELESLGREDQGRVGLAALVMLAQRAEIPGDAALEMIALLKQHPLSQAEHQLLALGWELRIKPGEREALLDRAMTTYQAAPPETKRVFGIWLNGQGLYERTLTILPLEISLSRKDLFLVHLDALAGLRRWREIEDVLAKDQVPIERTYAEVFLARCATEQNDAALADTHWRRARSAAASTPDQLQFVASYAERAGQVGQARASYQILTTNAATARFGYEGLLRLASREKDMDAECSVLEEMHKRWPQDAAVQNDLTYLHLLRGEDLAASRKTAEELVSRAPSSLPHRTTLALALLRAGDSAGAMKVYDDVRINWGQVPFGSRAVYAATLASVHRTDEARAIAKSIRSEALRPEERALLEQNISL